MEGLHYLKVDRSPSQTGGVIKAPPTIIFMLNNLTQPYHIWMHSSVLLLIVAASRIKVSSPYLAAILEELSSIMCSRSVNIELTTYRSKL